MNELFWLFVENGDEPGFWGVDVVIGLNPPPKLKVLFGVLLNGLYVETYGWFGFYWFWVFPDKLNANGLPAFLLSWFDILIRIYFQKFLIIFMKTKLKNSNLK